MSSKKKETDNKRYEIIDTTADIGIKAFGKNLPEIFESCAIGMFNIISDTQKIQCKNEYVIKLVSSELDTLLVNFLNELLYYKDTKNFVFADCDVKRVEKLHEKDLYEMEASVFGEIFQKGKHEIVKDIKAVTYHMLEINEKDGYATMIFDI